ncbi:MAG: hypothetical protein ACREHF_14675 [Rhizomicrobium sp.]
MTPARALALLVAAGCAALAAPSPSNAEGTLSRVAFTATSPLASNLELARRMLRPLEYAKLQRMLEHGAKLAAQPVDPAKETFALYVPAHVPANGYGLIVFVPPWNAARLPDGWGAVLDATGTIFVSAANSGNDQSVLARREPLALLAEANVALRYRLDPSHIVVAGFSGGSRVALRLALGYPDIFRGAILDAGSDPIGTAATPLPPRDLFERFQQTTHLVFVAGDNDTEVIAANARTLSSLGRWCVFGTDARSMMNEGHDAMDDATLSAALDLLAKPAAIDPAKLLSCRAGLQSDLKTKLAVARAALASGRREDAQRAISDIDAQYGGLAAPEIVDLAKSAGLP